MKWLKEIRRRWIPAGRYTRSVNQAKDYLLGFDRFKYLPKASAPPVGDMKTTAFTLGKGAGRSGKREYVGSRTTLLGQAIRRRKKRAAKARKMDLMPSIYHTLIANKKEVTLTGAEIKGSSNGMITESSYSSQMKSNISASVRAMLKTAARVTYIVDGGMTVQSAPTFQNVSDMTNNVNNQIYSFGSALWHGNIGVPNNFNNGIFQTLYNLTNKSFLNAQGITNTVGQNISTSRFYFDNVLTTYNLSNYSKESIVVDIYECVSKHDLSVTNWSAGTNGPWSPADAWVYGMDTSTAPLGITGAQAGRTSVLQIGSKPWQSQLFNTYWKISAQHSVILPVGGGHLYKTLHNIDQLMDPQRWTNSAILAGITRNVMFVVRGMVGYNTLTSTPDITGATLQVKWQSKYKMCQLLGTGNLNAFSTSSTNVAATVRVIDDNSVDYEDGVI